MHHKTYVLTRRLNVLRRSRRQRDRIDRTCSW